MCFSIQSPIEIRQQAHINCVNIDLYEPNSREATPYGVLDSRMVKFKFILFCFYSVTTVQLLF